METKSGHPDHDENRWMRRGLPPWPVLISFIGVVESGNVTKTALRLNLTQSAVSHHIAQLERFIGDRLFERSGKMLKPTAKAKVLAAELRVGLRALSDRVEEARPSPGRPDLHVVVAPELYRHWLEPRLNVFLISHPHVRLRISQDYRRDALVEDDADLHLRLGRPMAGEVGTPLCADSEFVVCSPGLAKSLPPKQAFAVAPFLTHADAYHTSLDWRRWLSELFGVNGERWLQDHLAKTVVLENFEEMLAACRKGEGFALVRTILVADEIASGRLVRAVTETLAADVNYSLVHRSGIGLSSAAQSFIGWLDAEAARLEP
ncbi:LysR family transcriptional regulator [Endobacterium cereale]|nr:LysR family transcriptional regulator [Endobacterium cereale]MEB2847781.1 LysR family transcriptional regulator [Endobacterium cereale]